MEEEKENCYYSGSSIRSCADSESALVSNEERSRQQIEGYEASYSSVEQPDTDGQAHEGFDLTTLKVTPDLLKAVLHKKQQLMMHSPEIVHFLRQQKLMHATCSLLDQSHGDPVVPQTLSPTQSGNNTVAGVKNTEKGEQTSR